ncbi:MAG: hypothetical protein U0835_05700 [Isosphaeraceae bacterium]
MSTADEGLLLEHQHPVSRRHVLLDANRTCGWLLLTVPDEYRIERDAFAFSPGLLVEVDQAVRAAKAGDPPPLAADYATDEAIIREPDANDFTFRWSEDGESVAVLHQGSPLAMIVSGAPRGYSRALGRDGFYGHPWDQTVYERVFDPHAD